MSDPIHERDVELERPPATERPPIDLPSGHDTRAALVWMLFHLRRNLLKNGYKAWAAVVVLVLGIGIYVGNQTPQENVSAVLFFFAPLMGLFFGAGVLREEIEDQTLTYPYTRPVGRAWLYAGRVLATAGPVALVCVPAACVCALDAGAGTMGRFVLAAFLAAAAYTSLFAFVGLLLKWPTWFGLAYYVIWESAVSQVPGFLGKTTIATHLRAFAELPPGDTRLAAWWDPPAAWESLIVLVAITAVAAVLGGQVVRRREFPMKG